MLVKAFAQNQPTFGISMLSKADDKIRLAETVPHKVCWTGALITSAHNDRQMNRRRKLVIALGTSAFVGSFSSFAQQDKVWRVGFLTLRRVAILESDYYYGPFRQGMRELGYVEGKNLVIEWRSADGKVERLPGLAAELVKMNVDLILAAGGQAAGAAHKATTIVPVVMVSVGDAVGAGLVESYARPGGNITGLANLNVDLGPKRLEMLLGMVPKLSRVAVLFNPSNPSGIKALESIQAEGRKRGMNVLRAEAQTTQEIETAFALMARERAGAVIVASDALFNQQVQQIAGLAAKHRPPYVVGQTRMQPPGISWGERC
jgi:putative ABC transport system substrate-binding protein